MSLQAACNFFQNVLMYQYFINLYCISDRVFMQILSMKSKYFFLLRRTQNELVITTKIASGRLLSKCKFAFTLHHKI